MRHVSRQRGARVGRSLAVVIVVALGATACFSAPKRTALNPSTPLGDVMRARAERLMAGDLEGFLRNLSPVARAAEEPIGQGALTAQVSSLEFVIGESVPASDGGLDRVEVEWVYRYRDVPEDNVFRFRRLYKTEPQGTSVLIVDSTEDPAAIPPLWATGPVAITRSPHFLVLTRPDSPLTTTFMPLAEDARSGLLPKIAVAALVADDVHVVVLATTRKEYEDYLKQDLVAESIAEARSNSRPSGAENREMVVDGSTVLSGAPLKYEDRDEVSGTEVVRHELGHLVLAKFTAQSTPAWVAEGAAQYLSGERREAEWAAEVQSAFANLSLGRLRTAEVLKSSEYPYANAAVLYLVEQFDAKTFFEFYQSVRRTGVDVALTRYYHTQDDRLDVLVQEWIRKQVGNQ